ncbi:hypothetical protein ACQEUU_05460 [Nonomuraea sp. CA-218870]|uniref:hypothetical protein n=1 Tax=Nonomuraea sp. CA-218870 TaxID=3239998 RepID=UPI003D940EA2
MTNGKLSRWPLTVQAAHFLLALELLLGVIGLILSIVAAVTGMRLALWGLAVLGATLTGLTGWILARFPKRERRVRWGATALQAVTIASSLVIAWIDSGFATRSLLTPGVLLPGLVIAMLLTPAAARWFDR